MSGTGSRSLSHDRAPSETKRPSPVSTPSTTMNPAHGTIWPARSRSTALPPVNENVAEATESSGSSTAGMFMGAIVTTPGP